MGGEGGGVIFDYATLSKVRGGGTESTGKGGGGEWIGFLGFLTPPFIDHPFCTPSVFFSTLSPKT